MSRFGLKLLLAGIMMLTVGAGYTWIAGTLPFQSHPTGLYRAANMAYLSGGVLSITGGFTLAIS